MGKLLCADLYRLWKVTGVRICMIVNVLFAAATILGTSLFTKVFLVAGEIFTPMSGIATMTQSLGWSSMLAIFSTVAVTLFASSGFAARTAKYPVTKGFSRLDIYFSGLTASSLFSVLMLLLYVGIATLTATLLWGFGTFTLDQLTGSLAAIFVQGCLHIALAALTYMVTMLLKNVGGALACNLLILTVFAGVICNLMNRLADGFDSNLYWILNNMMFLTNAMPSMVDLSRGLLVSAGFFTVSTLIGCCCFLRYEFK